MGLLAAGLLAACGSSDPGPPSQSVGTQLDGSVQASVAALPLTDSAGRRVRLADFRGKVLVLAPTMTLCQESCPIDTAQLVQTARTVDASGEGAHVEFLSLTVDPQRDTVPQIAAYRKLFAPPPANWQVLTGPASTVRRIWKYFGVYIKRATPAPGATNWRTGAKLTYDVQHSDVVFFFDPHGHERFVLDGIPQVARRSEIPATLYRYLSSAGKHNVAHPGESAWTVGDADQAIGWLLGRRIPV